MPVVWVCREHDPSGVDVELGRRHLFENGGKGVCVQNTPGAQLVAPLARKPGDLYIAKKRWSAFFGTSLDVQLRRLGVRRLILSGFQTPNCIRATAFDGISLDYSVTVLRDATASATPQVQESNLLDMERAGAALATTEAWAVQLAFKAMAPESVATLAGEGLNQGLSLANQGVSKSLAFAGEGIGAVAGAFGSLFTAGPADAQPGAGGGAGQKAPPGGGTEGTAAAAKQSQKGAAGGASATGDKKPAK